MGNGWHEWPLVLFTVLGQCVVGATIVSGLGWLALGDQREARRRLVRNMFFIWLLMGIGFLASVMHLGSPLRAFNSLNRIGASALSNEIASGALFFAVGGFWWLLAVLEKMPATLGKESVLFGDSTLALRQWMRENGIALEADGNEPEDHFGTVLLLAAWLCETEQDALFAQLLAWHLLPWSGRFLSVFVDHAAHPFYQTLGQLAQATLAQWQENLPIAVAQKPLYR
ncbi:Tat proofreading chaperone DmsD [Klebsiella pneumoniae]|nr:Tat proofreading chaperone DmsD [Klebsiella pneumoniae]